MTVERSALVSRLGQLLFNAARPGGGWPYYAGKHARIEPTAWALLALRAVKTDQQQPATDAWRFLSACQRADGLLVDVPDAPPNLNANGLTACVLASLQTPDGAPQLSRLLSALVDLKGAAIDQGDSRQNNSLQAWPWIPGTFSWVEPTCWALLALKLAQRQLPQKAESRIVEAEALLANRACADGGWNYGNGNAVGQDLRPYVPTSALGLIAMQDHRADPVVERSLQYLSRARTSEVTATALSLTSISLRLYNRPAAELDEVDARLAGDLPRAEQIGNIQALAMALYALSADSHGVSALRV